MVLNMGAGHVENLDKNAGQRILSTDQHCQKLTDCILCQAGMGYANISTVGHLLDSLSIQSIDSREGPLTLRATTPFPIYVHKAQPNQIEQSN